MIFGYDSGAVAALTCGIVGATPVAATITGTDGRIEVPGFFHATGFTVHRNDGSTGGRRPGAGRPGATTTR